MVFQWFHSTAYMMDDEVGSLVEKLKPQFVTKWLKTVCEVRFDVMVMCLLPKPVEFARVRLRSRSNKLTIYGFDDVQGADTGCGWGWEKVIFGKHNKHEHYNCQL